MDERRSNDDILAKAFGVAVAVGALAVGVASAVVNGERTRQMREEMRLRVDELGKRVDDLQVQAQRTIEENRPQVESAIERGRQAVVEGFEKARVAVEQTADKAQEYVQRTAQQAGGDAGPDTTQQASGGSEHGSEHVYEASSGAGEGSAQMPETIGDMPGDITSEIHDNQTSGGHEGSNNNNGQSRSWMSTTGHDEPGEKQGERSSTTDEGGSEKGHPTTPIGSSESNNDVENESPHPGDTDTTHRTEQY